jgi:hypothetical protein
MARISEMHKKWIKEPKYRTAYEALEKELVLAPAIDENARKTSAGDWITADNQL